MYYFIIYNFQFGCKGTKFKREIGRIIIFYYLETNQVQKFSVFLCHLTENIYLCAVISDLILSNNYDYNYQNICDACCRQSCNL